MADQQTLVVPYTDGHRITFTLALLDYEEDDGTAIGSIKCGGSSLVLKYGVIDGTAEHSATVSLPELYKAWVATFDPEGAAKIDVPVPHEELPHAGS